VTWELQRRKTADEAKRQRLSVPAAQPE